MTEIRLTFRNNIQDLGAVSFMIMCSQLQDIDLTGNPVCKVKDYRKGVKEVIPNLMILDEIPFYEIPPDNPVVSSSEYSSSLTSFSETKVSTTSSDNSLDIRTDIKGIARPASSAEVGCVPIQINTKQRPSTAGKMKSPDQPCQYQNSNFFADPCNAKLPNLTAGAPICGNIILAARRRDTKNQQPIIKQRKRIAWATSVDSSSNGQLRSASTSSMSSSSDANLVEMIPQESVELELGVVGMQSSSTNANLNIDSNIDIFNSSNASRLLEAARKWRLASRKSRGNFNDNSEVE